jgi:hypothetical protein
MPRIDFRQLPDHGRVWVFPATRRLSEKEADSLMAEVDAFLDGWAAHGAPLRSARTLVEDQFLLVGVDEDASQPSGCSIDALVNRLEELGETLSVRLVDHAPVWFRDGDMVRAVSRAEFRALAGDGAVDVDTPVFDTTITRLAVLREQGLEGPARHRWHGRAFFREQRAG